MSDDRWSTTPRSIPEPEQYRPSGTYRLVPTLTDFLLARIAEDEASGRVYWRNDRRNAECEAKRRIVARVQPYEWDDDQRIQGAIDEAEYACRILAAVYSDHPDYREEWRP